MDSYDVVIVGSGHNALITAAYLARAGRCVLVLERNDRPGGLIRTEELTLPGFHHDVYASAHPLFATSAAYADLGADLTARGLSYVNTDMPTGASFADGRTGILHRSMELTAAEADRLAPGDGAAFVDLIESFRPYAGEVFGLFGRELSDPDATDTIGRLLRGPGPGLSPFAVLMFDTARTLVSRFRSPVMRAMFGSWVSQLGRTIDEPGSGCWALIMAMGAMRAGMPIPIGGSQVLTDALARIVTDNGGRVLTGAEVTRIVVVDGRATAVDVAGGVRYVAEQAVVACTNPDQLYLRLLAAADIAAPLLVQAGRYRYGRGCVQLHLALSEPPRWPDPRFDRVGQPTLTTGLDDSALAVAQGVAGLLPAEPACTVECPTALDPSRAPLGYSIMRVQVLDVPCRPRGDAAGIIDVGDGRWGRDLTERFVERVLTIVGRHIPNLPQAVLAHATITPDDLARANPNCGPGDPYGGSHDLAQSYLLRPLPGQPSHRTPIPNLYQVGAATWPGHGVTGGSGYIVARQLLAEDRQHAVL
ncbi:MAG TPA: NAD(P)/FAD-dependent oxidoreductase [Catenuloplanes sp.]